MTYLEVVNSVLARLREDTVTTLSGSDDVVVELVKEFVKDAVRTVEDAHTWNALSAEWTEVVPADQATFALTSSNRSPIIDYIYSSEGSKLKQARREDVRRRTLVGSQSGTPQYFCTDGVAANGDTRITVWPAPKSSTTFHAYGFQRTAELVNDNDEINIAPRAVIHYAQAQAVRERGEAGAQPAVELLALAKRYLEDAIAKDATNQDMDNIWYS